MKYLDHPDSFHLRAAVGWLELGNWHEANEELENITLLMRAHPDVLQVRVKIYTEAGKWDYVAEVANGLCRMLPHSEFGALHLAHALRRLDRTAEARDTLLPIADQFATEWPILFQVACYSCKLGQKKDALQWLGLAIDVADETDIRTKALNEPDLETLWRDIAEISGRAAERGSL